VRVFLGVLAAIAVAIALYFVSSLIWLDTSYPAYTYRYRLSISPEIDGQVLTASSVIEVTAQEGPFGGGGAKLRGQAPYLDLGDRGTLVFSLGDDYGGSGRATLWIGAKAFGNDSSTPNIKKLPTLTGRRELPKDSIPVAFWFPKSGDLSVRRALLPQDFETAFGAGARIASASVEITRDPVVLDIDKKLPWLRPLMAKPSVGDVYEYYPPADRVRVTHGQLVRDEERPSLLARMLVAGLIVGIKGANRASCPDCVRR
jgi:hypothetical protein